MKRKFVIEVTVDNQTADAAEYQLRRLQERCHEVVSALVCSFKHARLATGAARISTDVTTVAKPGDEQAFRAALDEVLTVFVKNVAIDTATPEQLRAHDLLASLL